MKSISTNIIINAPVEQVWEVLMDHANYPKWNPFIKNIAGNAEPGSTLSVQIHPPEGKPMTFKPVVVCNRPQREFRWKGHLFVKGLFDGEHFFQLEALDFDQTQLIHGEHFSGVLSGMLFKMMETNTRNGFEAMNKALKQAVEQAFTQKQSA